SFTVDMIEEVPVVCFKPRKRTAHKRMLYFHGGAYVDDATALHFHFIDALIREYPMEVYMPIYPKTPTHTANQVIDTISRMIPALPSFDIIAGDSAGGGLALAVTSILRIKADHLILISPWLSLSLSHPGIEHIIPFDPLLNREYLREIGRMYKGELEWDDPRVSPLHAEFDAHIRVSVFCGTHEIFLPDIRDFVQRMKRTRDILYVEKEGMNHDYPLFPMKEGLEAVQKIVERIR
ncbi:MAG: alpha/beta hydrolase, partial [Sphaerochaetaceae bacterium]|nr:alpha/beta hydrolase [Sphaerochaetaceae bacterium]